MVFKTQEFIAAEIERTDALIRAAGETGEINFRPPYGLKALGLPYYLGRSGRLTIMWNIEPDSDPAISFSSDEIITHVLENASPGSIILLHVMYESRHPSLEAVSGIIEGLQVMGFEFVTITELINHKSP